MVIYIYVSLIYKDLKFCFPIFRIEALRNNRTFKKCCVCYLYHKFCNYFIWATRKSVREVPGCSVARLGAFTAKGLGSIPSWGTKMP